MLTMNDKQAQRVREDGNGTRPSAAPPDPEVADKPKRRKFSGEYKLRILKTAEACEVPGEIGALLRREGLYSSHLSAWRRQREKGALSGLSPKKRGRKPKAQTPEAKRIAELERKNRQLEREKQRLEAKLKRADLMLDIQKKTSELLGISLEEPMSDGSSS